MVNPDTAKVERGYVQTTEQEGRKVGHKWKGVSHKLREKLEWSALWKVKILSTHILPNKQHPKISSEHTRGGNRLHTGYRGKRINQSILWRRRWKDRTIYRTKRLNRSKETKVETGYALSIEQNRLNGQSFADDSGE